MPMFAAQLFVTEWMQHAGQPREGPMRQRAMLVLLLFAVASGPTRGDDAAQEAAKSLQGEWRAVKLRANGVEASEDDVKAFRMAVKGDEITLMTCKGDRCIERRKKYKLDPTKSPREIDLTALDGQEQGATQPCIYSVDEGRLRLCAPLSATGSSKRPDEFKTRAGDGLMVVVLERAKSE
jgi:uncharacterized protein (TIGR03067 family)